MPRIPNYCRHKATNLGYIQYKPLWGDKPHYFPGAYDSDESRNAYEEARAAVVKHMQSGDPPKPKPKRPGVGILVERFLEWAEGNYGEKEFGHYRSVARLLLTKHKNVALDEFGPLALRDVRDQMIDGMGWTRESINRQVGRVVFMFRWGIQYELVEASVVANLDAVPGLRKGKTRARESEPRGPVDWGIVAEVLPFLPPMIATMVQVQYLTGMRSDELTGMQPLELATNDAVWIYQPAKHKTAWRKKVKFICIGPKAQELLRPYFPGKPAAYFFSPTGALSERKQARWTTRKTKIYGMAKDRQPKDRETNDRYDYHSYQRAIIYAMVQLAFAKSGEPHRRIKHDRHLRKWLAERGVQWWHPHQLRHARATVTEDKYGKEAAAALIGDTLDAAKLYTWKSLQLARSVALEAG